MRKRKHQDSIGTIRASQIITTYGPGSLVDLPMHSVIVAGLGTWKWSKNRKRKIVEPRLADKIWRMTGVANPWLYPPPTDSGQPSFGSSSGFSHIGVRRFPQWFVVQSADRSGKSNGSRGASVSRRLVHRVELQGQRLDRFEGKRVVATRFVRACPKGHVDDLDWRHFVHRGHTKCRRPLWLDELGQSGDLADLTVRCECGSRRRLSDAGDWNENPLGRCSGKRPWLGSHTGEDCDELNRLLIRTATNAYFSQVVRVLSIPDADEQVREAVDENWEILQAVDGRQRLLAFSAIPAIAALRAKLDDDAILKAVAAKRELSAEDRRAKHLEIEAFLAAPEGFGDDMPVNPDYHARRLPESHWKHTSLSDGIDAVVQLHRLREVSALVGFTRFEAAVPDIDGEYDTDVSRADIDEDPSWFPAVENRGEGIFLSLRPQAVAQWLDRPGVQGRVESLRKGHIAWLASRGKSDPEFPGGLYVLLHTLAHLLMQALALRCGYPATSLRERIYLDSERSRYGLLLYTASPDADGTLGGLVQQARHIEEHLVTALNMGALCSSDPICAQHLPGSSPDERWLHGAACHSCSLIAETSCEMRNEFLDRALVVPTVDELDAAFFEHPA